MVYGNLAIFRFSRRDKIGEGTGMTRSNDLEMNRQAQQPTSTSSDIAIKNAGTGYKNIQACS
jgi:hypothetical protein